MIRTLEFKCSRCGNSYLPKERLYYYDDYTSTSISQAQLVCEDCINAWIEKWRIQSAEFHEKDCVLTVDLVLQDGTTYEHLDCSALDELGLVILGEDVPETVQKELYTIYNAWDLERKAHILKDCTFKEDFMNISFNCETYGGEKFEDVAFRVSRRGELQTAIPVPDYIKEQILEAYGLYMSQMDDEDFEPAEDLLKE